MRSPIFIIALLLYRGCTTLFPERNMAEWYAFDVKARKKVRIKDPVFKQLRNGRWAVTGESEETGIKVFRFLSKEEVEKFVQRK